MSEPKTEKTVSLELNKRELAVLQISLELRRIYHSPLNRNDLATLNHLIERVEAIERAPQLQS